MGNKTEELQIFKGSHNKQERKKKKKKVVDS